MSDQRVIVIGAGIAGLTAAALLAHEGVAVTLLESHHQPGGCAGTFCRGPYVFDVGATQVAGLGPGGIHDRLFRHLGIEAPSAEILNPGCVVDLVDGHAPIKLWYDRRRWKEERQKHFPGSQKFWSICSFLHNSNWTFVGRDPVMPIRNLWDFSQLLNALGPLNLSSGLLSMLTVADLLHMTNSHNDQRLRKYLDLQLRLYSQEPADRTALLYGATVLQMAHAPLGLWHLQGSMQKLSDILTNSLIRDGGRLLCNHRVVGLLKNDNAIEKWLVNVVAPQGRSVQYSCSDVVCTLPPQCLMDLLPLVLGRQDKYLKLIEKLPQPSGAIVFYGAINRKDLPHDCPTHLQLDIKDPGSLFLSISREGDGRAPNGKATVIASIFTPTLSWCTLNKSDYQQQKQIFLSKITRELEISLGLDQHMWLHKELATPRSFAKWTGRPNGIVGGLGQHPTIFGPFGFSSRTPFRGLWLCGDSIYPGEGTAGVSQSSMMVCRQLMANRGARIDIAN